MLCKNINQNFKKLKLKTYIYYGTDVLHKLKDSITENELVDLGFELV